MGALRCGRILSAPTVRVGKLLPFGERLCPVWFYSGVYETLPRYRVPIPLSR